MDEDNQVATLPSSSSQTRQSRLGLLRPKRRALIVGLAGVTGLIAVGGGLTWWARSPHPLCVYRGHHDYVKTVAWSPDGTRLASGGRDNTVQIWNAATGANIFTYRGHKDIVQAVAWSPDGKRIASASGDHTVQVWDANDGAHVYSYQGHSYEVTGVAWSPDGKRIASSSVDTTIQIWNAINGNLVSTIHSVVALTLAWSPDGTRLASGGNKVVQVWNASDGGNVYTYRGHSGFVQAVAWSPNGTTIASGGHDTTVQVWQAEWEDHLPWFSFPTFYSNPMNEPPISLSGTYMVTDIRWSPSGTYLASSDGIVHVWQPQI